MEPTTRIERTVDDLTLAYKIHNDKYNFRAKYISWMLVIAGTVIALSPANEHQLSDKFIIAGIFVFLGALSIWTRYNFAHRMAVQCPNVLTEDLLTLTEEELISETSGSLLRIKWEAFAGATISDDMVLLYMNRISFMFYPRRFFSEEQFAFLKSKAELRAARSQMHKTPIRKL